MQDHSNDWYFVETEHSTAQVESAVARLQKVDSDLDDDKHAVDEKITSLSAAVEEKDHDLKELNKRIEDLTTKNRQLVARTNLFAETETVVCKLEQILAMANAKAERRVESLEEEKQRLTVDYSDAQQAASKSSHQVEELKNKNKMAASKIAELKHDKDTSIRKMHAARDLAERAQMMAAILKDEKNELLKHIEAKNDSIRKMHAAQDLAERARRMAATLKDEKNELLKQVEALDEENKVLKQERDGLLAERTFYGQSEKRMERSKATQRRPLHYRERLQHETDSNYAM